MGSKRDILRRVLSGEISAKSAEAEVRTKLADDILKTTAGKPDSWLEARRTQLNEAWKKIHNETQSMFCAKGKHDRCTFDPNCSCECHGSPVVI